MVHVYALINNHVISIRDIEGMAHLIPIDIEKLYLMNNQIDMHTWNDIYDGN